MSQRTEFAESFNDLFSYYSLMASIVPKWNLIEHTREILTAEILLEPELMNELGMLQGGACASIFDFACTHHFLKMYNTIGSTKHLAMIYESRGIEPWRSFLVQARLHSHPQPNLVHIVAQITTADRERRLLATAVQSKVISEVQA